MLKIITNLQEDYKQVRENELIKKITENEIKIKKLNEENLKLKTNNFAKGFEKNINIK